MKKIFIPFALLLAMGSLSAQTIWGGPTMTFTKANFANHTQASNQDRITSNVWITRADTMGIYNIASENSYASFFSPEDTEWAMGTTDSLATATFNDWETTVMSDPPSMVGKEMTLHLITDDIYIDIKFTQWTKGRNGGGFTYERSTDPAMSIPEDQKQHALNIFPNPATNFISIDGISHETEYSIYNIIGTRVREGKISNNETIDISTFKTGVYFLNTGNRTIKFSKK